MKSVTLRGVDSDLAEKLKSTAKDQGKSINQLAIDLIKESLGLTKGKKFSRTHTDLDHLFGKWSDEEFNTISKLIDNERRIDPELWK
jgi:hypothetical protein